MSVVEFSFAKEVQANLTQDQYEFLQEEVRRRKATGVTSSIPSARGSNRNVNMSMLIREALERQYGITKATLMKEE